MAKEWKMNKMHGEGTRIYANGKIKRGIWEKGKLVKRKKLSKEEKAAVQVVQAEMLSLDENTLKIFREA